MEDIKTVFYKIKNTVPELTLHKGFGHCAYGSKLLHDELLKNNIQNKIIVINGLKDNAETEAMRSSISEIMSAIDTDDPLFGPIKKGYVKRGNRLPSYAGHAVVLVGSTVWDITSEQFGSPNTYSFKDLFNWWNKVAVADIVLNDVKLAFRIDTVKTKRIITNPQIGIESLTLPKPKFTSW